MENKTSIDQNELSKFNKTCKQWWDENGEFRLLHKINPVRIEYITSKIGQHFNITKNTKKFLSGLNIIDVGCGGGLVSVPLNRVGGNVTGLDANSHNIGAAKEYVKKNKLDITYLNETVEEHIKSKKKYDVVVCLEVIEHVANQKEFIHNLTKLLNDNGIIIISTINRTIKSYMLAIIMAEYVLNLVPQKTHDHSKFVKPSELNNMLAGTNLKIKELKGLGLSLPSMDWKLSDDIDINYFAVIS